MDCMMSSSFVPIYADSLLSYCRGKTYIDGSVTNNHPVAFPDRHHKVFQIWKWRWINPLWVLISTKSDCSTWAGKTRSATSTRSTRFSSSEEHDNIVAARSRDSRGHALWSTRITTPSPCEKESSKVMIFSPTTPCPVLSERAIWHGYECCIYAPNE